MTRTLPPPVDNVDAEAAGSGRLCAGTGVVDVIGEATPNGPAPAGAPEVPGLHLVRRLGAGAHGDVWLAVDVAAGDRVAVKVGHGVARRVEPARRLRRSATRVPVPPPPGADQAAERLIAARMSRELALLRRIDHPHVVRLRRVVDLAGGSRALVMDWAEGGSLADLVAERGVLAPAQASTVIVPLGRTLADLHARGMVHGDLTPGNVLFTATGRPMIADLGCAVLVGERPQEVWGTDGYVDPARTARPAAADDVYALGALLRFALTASPHHPSVPHPPDPDPAVDTARAALLGVADLCTAADLSRRPDPAAVARAVQAVVKPGPILLTAGGADAPVTASGADAPGTASGSAAARRGWVRPAPAAGGSVVVSLGGTPAGPLGGHPRAGTLGVPLPPADPGPTIEAISRVVTRRRSRPASPAAVATPAPPATSRWRLLRRDPRPSASPVPHRVRLGGLTALVATAVFIVAALAWWFVGARGVRSAGASSGPHEQPVAQQVPAQRTPTQHPTQQPARAASPDREPIAAALARLAQQRAAAFTAVSLRPLAQVDEPGSAAMSADVAFVRRLQSLGVRLDGLSFSVTEVRTSSGPGGSIVARALVTTSAHRQRSIADGGVRAQVAEGAARAVVLTLVPAADGQHWLVRSVTAQTPG